MSSYNCDFQARMHHAVTDTGFTGFTEGGNNPLFCQYSNHEIASIVSFFSLLRIEMHKLNPNFWLDISETYQGFFQKNALAFSPFLEKKHALHHFKKILGSESFTRWLGYKHPNACSQAWALAYEVFKSPPPLAYGRVWVSPPPHGISTTEPAFIELQKNNL